MPVAVLLSGGLDSAVLVAQEAARGEVQPIYVTVGLAWEEAERQAIEHLLASRAFGMHVAPLASLRLDMTDVYAASHWAVQGHPPGYHTPDDEVYLPGRNIVLLAKAGIYCASKGIARLLLGTLEHNPFPDATPTFRASIAETLSIGLAHRLQIEAPYADVSKSEVIRRGHALGVPLELTLSCMNPQAPAAPASESASSGRVRAAFDHCGACSKCRERHDAFLEAEIEDPTSYSDATNVELGIRNFGMRIQHEE
jgi:7-cyano-7-deazaguanine synthase